MWMALVLGLIPAVAHAPAPRVTYAPAPALFTNADLWLARCIYSETKRAEEMELVAWVVRNRAEAGYRGQTTYRGVVLDPYQFSAFNTARGRARLEALTPETKSPTWQRALRIAHYVRRAPAALNPLPGVLHFYSPRSMRPKGLEPVWARGHEPALVVEDRFRFYEQIR